MHWILTKNEEINLEESQNTRKDTKRMDNLKIMELYEAKAEKEQEKFFKEIASELNVKTEFEKVTEDLEWIEIMEFTVPYLDNILRNPNRFIINEEEIVKIELARKITVESIKHLSKNTNLIQDFDKKTGDVRPSKILNINKEESYDTYENRFIYSLIQNMKFFISRKKKAIELRMAISEKNNKQIDYTGTSKVQDENVNISIKLNTNLDAKNKNDSNQAMERIQKLEQKIADLTYSEVYKILDKKHMTLVTSPIKKTNVILKNVNFQYAVKLWNYMQENIDDKSRHINNNENYSDDDELKRLVDETFLLDYLIIKSLDKSEENLEAQEQARQEVTKQMLEKIIYLNSGLTEEQLKEMLSDTYAVMKYKNMASIAEIQKIFKEHINSYMQKLN